MERWRWLPHRIEPDYVAVNVPDASLSLVLNDHEMLQSRVVVGKPRSPTPILRAEGAGITVNPPWSVPNSIARKEILPKLKANSAYLRSQDMILLNGPPGDPYGLQVRWRDIPVGTFPYRLQQHPGLENALGTIKIELPIGSTFTSMTRRQNELLPEQSVMPAMVALGSSRFCRWPPTLFQRIWMR